MNGMDRSKMSKKIEEYDKLSREISDLEKFMDGCTTLCVDISARLGGCHPICLSDSYVSEIATKLRPIISNMICEREKMRDNL